MTDLANLLRLERLAEPAPWSHKPRRDLPPDEVLAANKVFCVELRNAFPALAAELTTLRERCARLRESHLIGEPGDFHCGICGCQNDERGEEVHDADCLAAPGAPDV